MGHQVIRQPDGLYAIFSSFTDTWIVYDATRQDVIDYYAGKAERETRESTARLLDDVDENPRKAYFQFAMTFEEANADSVESGGEDLSGKLTVQEAAATADIRPARLSADLTMADGRTVHVPVVEPLEPASAGKISILVPYPASAAPGVVVSAAVTNADLGLTFRRDLGEGGNIQPGLYLTVEFGEESLDAGDIARVFGEWP